mmetsp:Transcript_30413/g.98239  ORF Transcript_30413/g.98239 Transcript_30413/m.98239 type:complete len:383 (+) Transcript_30413:456-1604(+)
MTRHVKGSRADGSTPRRGARGAPSLSAVAQLATSGGRQSCARRRHASGSETPPSAACSRSVPKNAAASRSTDCASSRSAASQSERRSSRHSASAACFSSATRSSASSPRLSTLEGAGEPLKGVRWMRAPPVAEPGLAHDRSCCQTRQSITPSPGAHGSLSGTSARVRCRRWSSSAMPSRTPSSAASTAPGWLRSMRSSSSIDAASFDSRRPLAPAAPSSASGAAVRCRSRSWACRCWASGRGEGFCDPAAGLRALWLLRLGLVGLDAALDEALDAPIDGGSDISMRTTSGDATRDGSVGAGSAGARGVAVRVASPSAAVSLVCVDMEAVWTRGRASSVGWMPLPSPSCRMGEVAREEASAGRNGLVTRDGMRDGRTVRRAER